MQEQDGTLAITGAETLLNLHYYGQACKAGQQFDSPLEGYTAGFEIAGGLADAGQVLSPSSM